MQDMNYYYDFSGQKFGHPLSLSINGFDRQVFSRQTSLEFSYVLKGEYEAITEYFSCPVKEHELLLIAPGDIHMIRQKEAGENVILTIHVDFARFSKPMAGDTEGAFESMLCTEEKNSRILGELKKKIGELVCLLLENDNNLYQLNAIMAELVYIASNHRQYPIERLSLLSEHRENYIKAILYISDHYQQPLHLADVAKALSFSISYASRLFKKYTGITFVKYLAYTRIRASLETLLEGKDTIGQIAIDCGFPNPKAYTTAFQELYGITPSRYRKHFTQNLRYNQEMKEQQMTLDERQKELLKHLVQETEDILYENAAVKISGKDGHILCQIKADEKTKSIITQTNQTISIEIINDPDTP